MKNMRLITSWKDNFSSFSSYKKNNYYTKVSIQISLKKKRQIYTKHLSSSKTKRGSILNDSVKKKKTNTILCLRLFIIKSVY